jgi:hypothetical protein
MVRSNECKYDQTLMDSMTSFYLMGFVFLKHRAQVRGIRLKMRTATTGLSHSWGNTRGLYHHI